MSAHLDSQDMGFDFVDSSDSSTDGSDGPPSHSSTVGGGGGGVNGGAPPSPSTPAAAATPDAERQILLLMLLAQVCSLHDPTPRTFTVHVLSLFERGILDRESVRFLFDLGLVPGDYEFGAAIAGGGPASNNNLLEWKQEPASNEDGAIVPYKTTHAGTATATKTAFEESINIQVVEGVDSSDLNTGDSAILGMDEDSNAAISHEKHSNDPLRDILGDDIEEATRAHRRKIIEKSKAIQIAERKRREMEVQSIREHLERHDSRGDSAPPAPSTRAAAAATNHDSTASVDGSLRGGPPSNYPQTQQQPQKQQQNGNVEAGASWSVSLHPLSLSRYARDFTSIALLASGAFGDVYQARSNFDQTEYAIKRVCFTAAGYDNSTVQTVVREVQCLAQLDHPNCVRYYTSWLEPSWMTGGGKEVDIDRVGTEEERGRLLEGVKRLVLLEDGEAGESKDNVSEGGNEDTLGTLEQDLNQIEVSPRRTSSLNQYEGEQLDTGFTFESHSRGDQAASKTWDQLDSHNTYGSISTGGYGDSDDSSYSEWSDDDMDGKGDGTKRDFSARGGQSPAVAAANATIGSSQTSIPSIEGGERSGKMRSRLGGKAPYRQPQRQRRAHNREYKYRICLFVQMQLCRPSTLADWIQARNSSGRGGGDTGAPSQRNQPWVQPAFRIFLQIVRGLAHVHSKGIIHRDLKPANIFASLDDNDSTGWKIGDFGLSKMLLDANGGQAFESEAGNRERRRQKHQWQRQQHNGHKSGYEQALAVPSEAHTIGIGTASYAAPEQIKSRLYGPEADVYSLGLILLELFSMIDSLHERAAVFAECRKGVLSPRLLRDFPEVASLIAACTDPIPKKRPTAQTVRDTIEAFIREYDASPAASVAAQKRADVYYAEIKELRKQLKERDDEVDRLKRLLAERDAAISDFRSREGGAVATSHLGTFANRDNGDDDDGDILGVVESTMSSEEDY